MKIGWKESANDGERIGNGSGWKIVVEGSELSCGVDGGLTVV